MFDTETATIAEACALLHVGKDDLLRLMSGPNDPHPLRVTIRQLLAARIAFELGPVLGIELATKTGVTAGTQAQEGGGRLLIVTVSDDEPRALWRDALAGFDVRRPFLAVPADAWLAATATALADHRAAQSRLN